MGSEHPRRTGRCEYVAFPALSCTQMSDARAQSVDVLLQSSRP